MFSLHSLIEHEGDKVVMMTSRCQSLSIPTFISRKKHFPFLLQRQDSLRSRGNQALSRLRFQISLIYFHLLTHRGEEQHRSFSIFPDAEEETDELFSSFIVLQERHHFRFIDHFPRVFPAHCLRHTPRTILLHREHLLRQ